MKLSRACFGLVLLPSLAWACGATNGGDTPGGAASAGESGAVAGSLSLAGDGTSLGGENSATSGGAANNTGGTKCGSGGTSGTSNGTGGVVATGTTECSDGKDNDGDGLSDGFDPECTGPDDDDEGTFATGILGDNRDPKWQDCFFDGNPGASDDGCRYANGCLTGDLAPTDTDCKPAQACIDFCAPLVPNGCDCFGCCTVQLPDGGSVDIETTDTCSLAKIDEPASCTKCVKSDACGNTCGHCELCPGKTVADLPADCGCTGGGPSYTCDGGEQVCGSGLPACGLNTYCSLGCCIQRPPR